MTEPEGKPKVAFYWCASCGGCEEAVVDLAEGILDVVGAVDIVMWPVAMDFKRADVEAMPDGSILASFINGAIRTTEQEEMASLLRRKSKLVIAFGACSQLGGIPGLANLYDREGIYRAAYLESPSTENPGGTLPKLRSRENGYDLSLPGFYETVRALGQVIDVDYAIPGCAPHPTVIQAAVATLLSGELPPKGTVLAPDQALCEECPRRESKPLDLGAATCPARGAPVPRAVCSITGARRYPESPLSSGPTTRRRSTPCWKASRIRSGLSTATAFPPRCCGGRRRAERAWAREPTKRASQESLET
jgi:F420-non-reducing hydrogenase small subunit